MREKRRHEIFSKNSGVAKSFYRLEISEQIREEKQQGLATEKTGLDREKVSLTAERESSIRREDTSLVSFAQREQGPRILKAEEKKHR